MKITNIYLENFIPFGIVSKIKKFTMELQSSFQLFIGMNGTGKSALLRELNPFPAVKSSYKKNGLKIIELEHKQSKYKLTSDFSLRNHVHSFIRDQHELNISGTTQVQQELISTHLGYTPFVHNLLYFKYKFCSMSKAERKNYLFNINPLDLSLVLQLHKNCTSKLKECKSNINLLTKRKLEIQDKLIDEHLLKEKYKEKQQYEYINSELNQLIFYLNNLLSEYENSKIEYTSSIDIDLNRIKLFSNKVNLFLCENKNITEYESTAEIIKIDTNINYIKNYITENENKALNIVNELEGYDKNLLNMNEELSVSIIENTLKEKEELLLKLKSTVDEKQKIFIPESDINNICSAFEEISQLFLYIRDIQFSIITNTQQFNKCQYKEIYLKQLLNNIIINIKNTEEKIKSTEEQLTQIPRNNFAELDLCIQCNYKNIWTDRISVHTTSLIKYRTDLEQYNKQKSKLERVYNKLQSFVHQQQLLRSYVFKIITSSGYSQNINLFVTDENKLISILNKNKSTQYLKHIETIILLQPQLTEILNIEKEIQEIKYKIETLNKTNTPVLHLFKEMYNNKNKELISIQNIIKIKDKELNTLEEQRKKYLKLSNIKETTNKLQNEINKYEEHIKNIKSIEFIKKSIQDYTVLQNDINLNLRQIDVIVKEQESLRDRLNNEIIELESKIEKSKVVYEVLEYGLSPVTGFTHEQLIEQINILIRNVNVVISQLWSYPMQLIELDPKEDLDYSFPIITDGELADDLNNLSSGQEFVVNLAWLLVSTISMRLTDYPIYLDESLKELDPDHAKVFLNWFKEIQHKQYVNQIFLISHDAINNEELINSNVLCLKDYEKYKDLIPNINKHVIIKN